MTSLLYCCDEGIFPLGSRNIEGIHYKQTQTDYSYHILVPSGDIYSSNKNLVLQQVMLFIPTALPGQQCLLHVSHRHSQIVQAEGPNASGNIHKNQFVAFLSEPPPFVAYKKHLTRRPSLLPPRRLKGHRGVDHQP